MSARLSDEKWLSIGEADVCDGRDAIRLYGEAFAEGDRARRSEVDMLAVLEGVAKWCHQGHGDFQGASCGLCGPVHSAIMKARSGT